MEEISFEELRKVHLEEKHSPFLLPLVEDYYAVYLEHIDKFYSGLKGEFSMEGAKVYENSRKVFLELVRLRCQKVILKAFKDNRGGASTEGLTLQEKELYLSLLKTFNSYENNLATFRQNNAVEVATAQRAQGQVEARKVNVEMLVDVPTFISPTGKAIGPLHAGNVVEVDEATAAILVEKNAGKIASLPDSEV